MPIGTAGWIFYAIATVMACVWLVGTRFAFARLRRLRGPAEPEHGRRRGPGEGAAVTGEAVLEGDPEVLSRAIAERLTAPGPAGAPPLARITERTPERIAFERPPPTGRRSLLPYDGGEITLRPEGRGVRVRYAVRLRRLASTMTAATYLVCFAYGGIFLVGVPAAIWFLVLHHDNPIVRWQVIQTAQMVHGVWPPFLVGHFSSRARRTIGGYFDALLESLRYRA